MNKHRERNANHLNQFKIILSYIFYYIFSWDDTSTKSQKGKDLHRYDKKQCA